MPYATVIKIVVTYDTSDNEEATRLLHVDYITTLKNQVVQAVLDTNKANFYFKVLKVTKWNAINVKRKRV